MRIRDVLLVWSCGCLLSLVSTARSLSAEPSNASPLAEAIQVVAKAKISPWKPIFVGIEMCEASTDTPRPLQVRAVRVDLKEPTIRILVTPSNGDKPMDCDARTTSRFLSEFKCQVAINGSAFAPFAVQQGSPQDVHGLSMSRGDLYSPANQYDAFLVSEDRKAWVDQAPIEADGAHNGLSGFYALLIKGRNIGRMKAKHPRSAVGVSKDGRYLILMTVDGRQPGASEGTSTAETAEWMRELGAYNALNLDGGGSTALVMEGADGKPVVLNRPSGNVERLVANHVGVFADSLPESEEPEPNADD